MEHKKPELPEMLRQRLLGQANLLAAVTAHGTLIGLGRERALSALLRELLPRRFELLSGTVVSRDPSQKSVTQIDVMVVDTVDYPTLVRDGDIAVVLPQAVRAVVEVKSDLAAGQKFLEAVEQVAKAQLLLGDENPVLTVLYCYGAPTNASTLRGWIETVLQERRARRDKLTAAQNDDTLRTQASVLSAANLPSLIVSEDGAIGWKLDTPEGTTPLPYYRFFSSRESPVLFLAGRILSELGPAIPADTGRVSTALGIIAQHLSARVEPVDECADLTVADEA